MISMSKHKLVAKTRTLKFFSKSKFAHKPKIGTALDSVFCQLCDYKIKSDFLLNFDIKLFFHNNNNLWKISTPIPSEKA